MKIKKVLCLATLIILCLATFTSCTDEFGSGSYLDQQATMQVAADLASNQPTPTDISYSLERYNLIRRAYWVNGMEEKANTLPCPIEKPLSYVVLFSGNTVFGSFVVDGKVSSLNSFLSPDSQYYEYSSSSHTVNNKWLADVDGSYGENDQGIFFFTPEGHYMEWTGDYLYSDTPFEVSNPVVRYEVN